MLVNDKSLSDKGVKSGAGLVNSLGTSGQVKVIGTGTVHPDNNNKIIGNNFFTN